MWSMIIRQLIGGITTLFVVMTLTFVLLRLLPGGPFDQERALPAAIKQNMEAKYHLTEPIWVQYGYYVQNLVHGDLGPSYKFKSRSVTDIVSEATGVSTRIGLMALVIGTLAGVVLGAMAGIVKNRLADGLLSFVGVSSISMPSFIFGGLLVLVFALSLKWLPAATLATPAHYVLPVLTLSLVPFSYSFLLIRTTVREMRHQQFVQIKRSFGLKESVISVRHILRNSLLPLVSILGPIAAAIITGSFAVEYIFAVPGLGKHFVTAVSNRDYTLVMGITLVYSLALVVFNTLTDLLYGYLDPRFRDAAKTGDA